MEREQGLNGHVLLELGDLRPVKGLCQEVLTMPKDEKEEKMAIR